MFEDEISVLCSADNKKNPLLLVRRTQTVGSSLNSKLIPASSREHDCSSHLNTLPTSLMTSGQSRQTVKCREYTWPVPRPQLHLLLIGKFHSHWVLGLFGFFFKSWEIPRVTVMPSEQLEHTASYCSSPRLVELHFLRATLDVYKEKIPTRFECSTWLSHYREREKRKAVHNFIVWVLLRTTHEKET